MQLRTRKRRMRSRGFCLHQVAYRHLCLCLHSQYTMFCIMPSAMRMLP